MDAENNFVNAAPEDPPTANLPFPFKTPKVEVEEDDDLLVTAHSYQMPVRGAAVQKVPRKRIAKKVGSEKTLRSFAEICKLFEIEEKKGKVGVDVVMKTMMIINGSDLNTQPKPSIHLPPQDPASVAEKPRRSRAKTQWFSDRITKSCEGDVEDWMSLSSGEKRRRFRKFFEQRRRDKEEFAKEEVLRN